MARRAQLQDSVVVYYSREDGCWVGHSLNTDQIGTGDCVVDALADVLRAIDHVVAAAREDRTLRVERPAPSEIQDMARRAKRLPGEVYEIAHKKARGNWPTTLSVNIRPTRKTEQYRTDRVSV